MFLLPFHSQKTVVDSVNTQVNTQVNACVFTCAVEHMRKVLNPPALRYLAAAGYERL